MRTKLAVIGLLAAAFCRARQAAAEPPRPGLDWVRLPGAERCIGARELAERVELRLGKRVFAAPADAELFVDGVIAPAAAPESGFVVRLWVADDRGQVLGERALATSEAECRALDDAVTLVIALTLNPDSELAGGGIPLAPALVAELDQLFENVPSELDPSTLPPAPPVIRPPARAARAEVLADETASSAEPPAWHAGLDLAAAGSLGMLPAPSPALALRAGLERAGIGRVELGAYTSAQAQSDAHTGDRGGAQLQLLLGSLSACGTGIAWLGELRPCLGLALGSLRMEPEGFARTGRTQRSLVASALGGLLLRRPLWSPIHYRVGLTLGVPLTRVDYTYSAPGDPRRLLFRTPSANLQLELGLGVEL